MSCSGQRGSFERVCVMLECWVAGLRGLDMYGWVAAREVQCNSVVSLKSRQCPLFIKAWGNWRQDVNKKGGIMD